jgi:hypothetical protein
VRDGKNDVEHAPKDAEEHKDLRRG